MENHSGSGMEIDNVETALVQYCVSINNRTGRGLDGAGFDLDGGTTRTQKQLGRRRKRKLNRVLTKTTDAWGIGASLPAYDLLIRFLIVNFLHIK